jgi:hypothetical protein
MKARDPIVFVVEDDSCVELGALQGEMRQSRFPGLKPVSFLGLEFENLEKVANGKLWGLPMAQRAKKAELWVYPHKR